ncbi:hypothetical protein PR048_029551 [Dryococelus australis]|uniref:Uncharacterized protein n=1 Tax=Dryococelus australis TaxID=614101 RepID=A0ABQ9GE10_9NEOP|nr:hypothetical protein PR048_029551 [Dryococelus australis]
MRVIEVTTEQRRNAKCGGNGRIRNKLKQKKLKCTLFLYSAVNAWTEARQHSPSDGLSSWDPYVLVIPGHDMKRDPRMERRWIASAGETGVPRENLPGKRHRPARFPHPGVKPAGYRNGGGGASALTTVPHTDVPKTSRPLTTMDGILQLDKASYHRPKFRRSSWRVLTTPGATSFTRHEPRRAFTWRGGEATCGTDVIASYYASSGYRRPYTILKAVGTFEINLRKKSLHLPEYILTGALSDLRLVKATSYGYNSSYPVWHALYECLQDIYGDSSPFLLQPFHELSNGFCPRLTSPYPAIQFVSKMFNRVEVRALGGPVQSANIVVGNVTIGLCVHATTDKHQRSYAEGRETQVNWRRREQEIDEKTGQRAASYGTIPTCENPGSGSVVDLTRFVLAGTCPFSDWLGGTLRTGLAAEWLLHSAKCSLISWAAGSRVGHRAQIGERRLTERFELGDAWSWKPAKGYMGLNFWVTPCSMRGSPIVRKVTLSSLHGYTTKCTYVDEFSVSLFDADPNQRVSDKCEGNCRTQPCDRSASTDHTPNLLATQI